MSGNPTADVDPGALLDRLVDEGAVDETAEDELVATEAFESTHAVYRDTYLEIGDDEFRGTVAELFGIDESEAAARIEELGVTRAEIAAYLALRSFLEDPPAPIELATMAAMVVEVAPPSPVPEFQTELDDGSYESFLAEHPDAVVFVWKRDCLPCERMKHDLEALLATVPDGYGTAGVDGDAAEAFRAAYEVTSAPTTLVFRDGELVDRATGRLRVAGFADLVEGADAEN